MHYINDPKTQPDALKIMSGARVGLTPAAYKPLLKGTHLDPPEKKVRSGSRKARVSDRSMARHIPLMIRNVANAVYKQHQDIEAYIDASLMAKTNQVTGARGPQYRTPRRPGWLRRPEGDFRRGYPYEQSLKCWAPDCRLLRGMRMSGPLRRWKSQGDEAERAVSGFAPALAAYRLSRHAVVRAADRVLWCIVSYVPFVWRSECVSPIRARPMIFRSTCA